jgi:hypothetical protein
LDTFSALEGVQVNGDGELTIKTEDTVFGVFFQARRWNVWWGGSRMDMRVHVSGTRSNRIE